MDYVTWASMGTLAGAVIVILLITQYVKKWLGKFDIQLFVVLLAQIILQAVAFILGYTWQEHIISIINAFIVATSAMGTFDSSIARVEAKK
jgi:hypothetical protein